MSHAPETESRQYALPMRALCLFPRLIQTVLVGREGSVQALNEALRSDARVLVVAQREHSVETPTEADLYRVGTLAEILHILPMPDGTRRVALRGLERVQLTEIRSENGTLSAHFTPLPVALHEAAEAQAALRECLAAFEEAVQLGLNVPPEVTEQARTTDSADELSDLIAQYIPLELTIRQSLLEETNPVERLRTLIGHLAHESKVLQLQASLRAKVEREIGDTQREILLREQMRLIQRELDDIDPEQREADIYRERLLALNLHTPLLEKIDQEIKRLARTPASTPEGTVLRNYLDTFLDLPWQNRTEDRLDLKLARTLLDEHHSGLEEVKERILDELAVRQLGGKRAAQVLCFVGPPGVGKTTIGRSIAESMGRAFHRISLAGVRDEAELRGHRRTYIGSMPGRIIAALRTTKTKNPVLMLDEADKMALDGRGDPATILLEILDPEQNHAFVDHYIEHPFDLSEVLFILTANLVETLPPALRDRLEIIRFPSYTEAEKINIAHQHLIPRAIAEHGLTEPQFPITPEGVVHIVRAYTHESGIRQLDRTLNALARKAARATLEHEPIPTLNPEQIDHLVGPAPIHLGRTLSEPTIGAVQGLVYTPAGGDTIIIEALLSTPSHKVADLRLTGRLGEVMKESALTATSWVRLHQRDGEPLNHDIHVHVPEGSVPKDGPSAGLALVVALTSALTQTPVRPDICMTGEITLRGEVLPVGGIREKLLAAHRAGIPNVIIPAANLPDLHALPEEIRAQLKIHPIYRIEEALPLALITISAV